MPINRKEFDVSIDKNKSLCRQLRELFEKHKDSAFTFDEIVKELSIQEDHYPNNLLGYIGAGVDIFSSFALTFCLISLENSGLVCLKRIRNETRYIWCAPQIRIKPRN